MTDIYINSVSGDDGTGDGTSGTPYATISKAHTEAVADDRIIVQYAGGTAYTVGTTITISKDRLVITGQDSGGTIFADDPWGYDRTEYPHIDVTATTGFDQSTATEIEFYGLELDGGSTSARSFNPSSGSSVWTGCYLHDFTAQGIRPLAATIRECRISSNGGVGIETGASNVVVESCILDNNSGLALFRFSGFHTGLTVTNCTIYANAAAANDYATDSTSGWTYVNCLWVDNRSRYGFVGGGVQTTGDAYSSDGNTVFHTVANYNGAPNGTHDLELNPQFVNAGSADFHIQNATLISGGTSNSIPRLYDGTTMPATPPIGALGGTPRAARDWYVDSANGDDGTGTGDVGNPWQTIGQAVSNLIDNDRIVLEYANGTAYALTAAQNLTYANIVVTGRDSAGVICADSIGTFNRAEKANVTFTDIDGFVGQLAANYYFHGLELGGAGATGAGRSLDLIQMWTGSTVLVEVCDIHDTRSGIELQSGTVRETRLANCAYGIGIDTGDVVVEACIFESCDYDVDNTPIIPPGCGIVFGGGGQTLTVTNSTFWRCGQVGYFPISSSGGVQTDDLATLTNVLVVDGAGAYGLVGSTHTNCNSWSSDAGTYHTTANWSGTKGGTDLEADPLFEDAPSGVFYIGEPTLETGGAATTVARLYSGATMPSPPPVGALDGTFRITGVTVDSAEQVTVSFNTSVDAATVALPSDWTIVPTSVGIPVTALSITLSDSSTAVVQTWPRMSCGAEYTITAVNATRS